jgi:MraZ protein
MLESGTKCMIIGQFNHNLDTKNRLMIPAKIRANINTSVVITLSVDGCLEVRTLDEFNIFTEKFTNIDSSSERERIISR